MAFSSKPFSLIRTATLTPQWQGLCKESLQIWGISTGWRSGCKAVSFPVQLPRLGPLDCRARPSNFFSTACLAVDWPAGRRPGFPWPGRRRRARGTGPPAGTPSPRGRSRACFRALKRVFRVVCRRFSRVYQGQYAGGCGSFGALEHVLRVLSPRACL